jgi:hypothetical protein
MKSASLKDAPSSSHFTDEQLLREVQRRAVRFFWEKADSVTGLINDRANNFGDDGYTVASIAATGYGLAALPVGVVNGWLDRGGAANRARTTLRFLLDMSDVRGWLVHHVDKRNGERVWGSEHSSIDTALLVAGALVCGQYFARDASTRDIYVLSDALYRRIDWLWMLTNNNTQPEKKVLSHGWKPETGFISYNYEIYSEAVLLYLLGLGAPVDPLPATAWSAFQRPPRNYNGIESTGAGPIFIYQMPFGYFYLGNQRDQLGFDYWVASKNAMQIHRQFCIDRAGSSETYAQGFWGLNASDGPDGYAAYGAPDGPEDGTVSPTGAICSITFTPELAISATRALYDNLGNVIWGRYGFADAFNIGRNWYGEDVIGIDLGMALVAIENYCTGFIWNLMGSFYAAIPAFQAAGFYFTAEAEPKPIRRGKRLRKSGREVRSKRK